MTNDEVPQIAENTMNGDDYDWTPADDVPQYDDGDNETNVYRPKKRWKDNELLGYDRRHGNKNMKKKNHEKWSRDGGQKPRPQTAPYDRNAPRAPSRPDESKVYRIFDLDVDKTVMSGLFEIARSRGISVYDVIRGSLRGYVETTLGRATAVSPGIDASFT